MQFPQSTGQVAESLGVPEPRINDLIRRRKVAPPPVAFGRRQWHLEQVLEVAEVLGVLTPDLAARLEVDRSRQPRQPGGAP